MPNMPSIINKRNKEQLSSDLKRTPPSCNCRDKNNCPLEGKCRTSSVIYKATLSTNNSTKHYYGCCEPEFKSRFYNHKQSFKFKNKANATELSKAVWQAKDAGNEPQIKWSIVTRTTPYQPGAKTCNLCLSEKLTILRANPSYTLNKRSELTGKCRHRNKYKLKKF